MVSASEVGNHNFVKALAFILESRLVDDVMYIADGPLLCDRPASFGLNPFRSSVAK
jgi:hypothetical protein